MAKVLISGSSGFLAQHICKLFAEKGHEIVGVDKRPGGWTTKQVDVFDLNFRDIMGVDYIVHLAWRTNIPDCSRHPEDSTRENIDMTIHMLELAKEAGVKKFFFPSTASLYGNNPTPWTEDMPAAPIEHYSWQKLACESACKMYTTSYGLDTVVARFYQIYGQFQRDDTALAAFMRSKKAGKPVTLTETVAQSSFRSAQRDFTYAGDVAEAVYLLTMMEKVGGGEIYNVCTGNPCTMEDIALAIEADVTFIPRRDWEVERHEGSPDKLKKLLDWQPSTDVIQWLKANT